MINQLKIQLNLYSHRDKDNDIITKLQLDSSPNPNNRVRELLYSLSSGQSIHPSQNHIDTTVYTNKISELEKLIDTLKHDNAVLKAENNILKSQNIKVVPDEISATKTSSNTEARKDINTSTKNTKLLGSIKSMDI